jgi:hypothetical protein
MNELLSLATQAHGGLENWEKVKRVDIRLNLSGYRLATGDRRCLRAGFFEMELPL